MFKGKDDMILQFPLDEEQRQPNALWRLSSNFLATGKLCMLKKQMIVEYQTAF